jgi:dTDP-4-dehydrorhamnose reductase
MRALITGAAGQIGRELAEHCQSAEDEVVALAHGPLDVTDRDQVLQAIGAVRPAVVYHLAAWTAVDDCELDPDRAFRVNALGTRYVADAARRFGAHVLYVSTDYVFDGQLDRPYAEWDTPNPQSIYGRTKHAGELELTGAGGDSTVVRTSWVCGRHGANIVRTILRLAGDDGSMHFVDDQRGNPTIVSDLVPMLRALAVARHPGLVHVTNQGSVTWFEFARNVLAAIGDDPARVLPITTAELDPPRPAPRPANSVLDNAVLRLSGLPMLPDYRESLGPLIALVRREPWS